MGVPYFLWELLCVQLPTLCLSLHGHDPNLTISLHTFTVPPLPPSQYPPPPPPCCPSTPTHMWVFSRHWHRQIWYARKMLTLTILLANVSRHCQKLMVLAMAKFSGRVALLTKQTAHPSSQEVYLWLACRQRWTALQTVLFQKVPGGGPQFPHPCHKHKVHIIVILLVINFFFSSFNNVDLLRSMSADCCMPRRQEWGTMAAMGGQRPPWLACVYFT